MSVSSLPEWKQLLLERKRREEEQRERREKEEEEKLASMPAWKRGIIQRRKAKQESLGDRDREVCLLQVDARTPDGLSDTDSSITVNLGSEMSLSPDPGMWLDTEAKPESQVSVETIVPVHENPFIRTQSVWRKGKDPESANEVDVKEKEYFYVRSQELEMSRGRDIELKIEKFRDLTEGWEKDKSREKIQGKEKENNQEGEKDKNQWTESGSDVLKEQDFFKMKKEEKDTLQPSGQFPSVLPCLRTIRADNIIIIEQDRKGSDERRARWREVERETPEEDQQGKRGMKMDLREILAGGGSVTEIRASEVLIIKPSISPEGRTGGGKSREEGEMRSCLDLSRDMKLETTRLREKEKDRPWGQATVINKEDRGESCDDNVFIERGGRVSQLLSKFGGHPTPPSRSKSSDNFLQPGRRKYSGDQDDRQSEERKANGKNEILRSIPKRSFSFSDRVIGGAENGLGDVGGQGTTRPEKNIAPWVDVAGVTKLRSSYKERFGKQKDLKTEEEKSEVMQEKSDAELWKKQRSELKKVEPVNKRATEKVGIADGDKGFTIASVKNTEGISFARRVPIRQDSRARAEKDAKRLTSERSFEQDSEASEAGGIQRDDTLGRKGQAETNYIGVASEESLTPTETPVSRHKHESAFTECSSLPSTVLDWAPHRGPESSGSRPQGPYLMHSNLSQQTNDLISKKEQTQGTTIYINEREERANTAALESRKEESKRGSRTGSEREIPRPTKSTESTGIPPGPLEVQIPRTVFYVAEEMVERKGSECRSSEGHDWEGRNRVERRDSWRTGKPLSRIESLREKIRQRELDKQRPREARDVDRYEAANICDAPAAEDRYNGRGSEIKKQWEAAACVQSRPAEQESTEGKSAEQTSMVACDVKQEVSMLKTNPQLPVSVPSSQDSNREEVSGECSAAASEVPFESSQFSEDETDPLKHVKLHTDHHRGQYESAEEEEEEEERELSEEELDKYTSSTDSLGSLSPSPPHPSSLVAMSRIYNLDTVGSRSGLYLRDRTVDIKSSVHLVKVKPFISSSQQGDSKGPTGEDLCGAQTIQQQIEQFQLKEQDVLKSPANTPTKERETKSQQSPKRELKPQRNEAEETPEWTSKESPQHLCTPTSQLKQTITINPSFVRNQSPENSLKPTNSAPTPASSPCSPSPANSPSISPSPSPSPKLFSIRSASGGQVKRGATITINPKKTVGGGGTGSSARPTAASGSAKTPSQQTMPPTVDESAKKRYPAVEEIEVIGGYQSLERSCLIKSKVTPKRGKVCFDEDQLEQVCEYPSETFMLTLSPLPYDLEKKEKMHSEEAHKDAGEGEGGAAVFKNMKGTGTAAGPRLRVGQCHPRLRKNKV
ncbi:trichohyalin isoform X1 [Cyprinodon tularosa]|uniref:trichohyalin isoform X1 n=1 Tax=Cyprinodon tularosa TaxID=77115 RepID=UPI0018E2893F|nr:trichohyalin isoform X1 [Cyprinodon tularosa]XP_038132963.1 trichohyalin isoform X1 [Cyprinodon tularosa]